MTQRLVTSKDRRGDELDGKKTLKLMVKSEESTQTKEYMKEHEDQSRGCHLQLLLVRFRVPVTSKLNQTPQMRTSRPEHLLSHATQDAQHVENSLNTNAVTGPSARGADTAYEAAGPRDLIGRGRKKTESSARGECRPSV